MASKLPWSVVVAVGLVGVLSALQGAGARQAAAQAEKPAEKKEGPGETADPTKPEKIKPYDKVITKEAKTSAGLFLVHRLEEKVFYEIPTEELGKPMLWVTQLEQDADGPRIRRRARSAIASCGGNCGDDIVLLRDVKYVIRADVERPDQGRGGGELARGDHRGRSRSRPMARTSGR